MVPLAVLRQYVKVLLGKHGLELCDVGRQWSSGSCKGTPLSPPLNGMTALWSYPSLFTSDT